MKLIIEMCGIDLFFDIVEFLNIELLNVDDEENERILVVSRDMWDVIKFILVVI